MDELEKQLQGLRDEKQKLEELADERERGTAKGRSYEEAVAEAVDRIADVQGDVCRGRGRRARRRRASKGDVSWARRCAGPARGRIVFEAKDKPLSKPRFYSELDETMEQRDADYAVLVVPTRRRGAGQAAAAARVPGRQDGRRLRPRGRLDARAGVRLPLARARVLTARGGRATRSTPAALRATVGARATPPMDDVRKVKSQLTSATSGIERPATRGGAAPSACEDHLDAVERWSAHAPDDEARAAQTTACPGRAGELGAAGRRCPVALGQQQLVVARGRARARCPARPAGSPWLDRLLGAGAHLVLARRQRLLDRAGVLRAGRADGLLDGLALERDRVGVVGLVGDRDHERAGAARWRATRSRRRPGSRP